MVWSSCNPRDSTESSPAPQFKSINSLTLSLLYGPTLTSIHDSWKNQTLIIRTSVSKVMSLLFNTLFMFVIAFLPRSKSLSVVSDSLRPHGLQPTRLLPPWDSPGKSIGVGCQSAEELMLLNCGAGGDS